VTRAANVHHGAAPDAAAIETDPTCLSGDDGSFEIKQIGMERNLPIELKGKNPFREPIDFLRMLFYGPRRETLVATYRI
jgi:hypothetical protein